MTRAEYEAKLDELNRIWYAMPDEDRATINNAPDKVVATLKLRAEQTRRIAARLTSFIRVGDLIWYRTGKGKYAGIVTSIGGRLSDTIPPSEYGGLWADLKLWPDGEEKRQVSCLSLEHRASTLPGEDE